ncbi:uncharacterized transporter slc-17.2-like [Haliotis asinina]|uniref:uncharacterized transporter slc-17.2-like n=1 Tax=Haliotis asinina TaxID=109174 RepID=UPI003531BA56
MEVEPNLIIHKDDTQGKCRYWLALLVSVGLCLGSCFRASLGITIVCMIRHSSGNLTDHGGTLSLKTFPNLTTIYRHSNSTNEHETADSDCPAGRILGWITSDADELEMGEFEWSKETQGIVLGAMFWGYLCLQIPCGLLAERFGPRKVIGIGIILCSASTLFSPVAARTNVYILVALRVLTGAFVSVLFTSLPAFWVRWAPKSEISSLQSIAFAGSEVGNALVFPLSGFLCRSGFGLGWPSVFYVIGGLGFVWSLFWILLARDKPGDQPCISMDERTYIERHTKARIHKEKRIPWGDMMKSRASWTVILTHTLYNYAYYMLQLQLPTYLNEVMHFDIQSNGVLVMMPYLCSGVVVFLSGWLVDTLIRNNYLSRDNTRKLMNSIAGAVPAVLMISLAQLDCRGQVAAVVLLCLAGAANGFAWSGGFMAVFVEIALGHSATLYAVSNTIASIPGIVAPYVVSLLTPTGSQSEWQSALYVAAGILLMSTIIFLFSTSAPQHWALPPAEDTTVVVSLNEVRKEDAL